jgi:predicted transcriptional regulator
MPEGSGISGVTLIRRTGLKGRRLGVRCEDSGKRQPRKPGERGVEGGRQYRSKLEMLRDFLAAAQTETRKTRIMNRANLNQTSFARYVTLCQQRQLLTKVSGGYMVTPRAEELLLSINRVLSKASDLQHAVDVLNRTARSGGYLLPVPEVSVRALERINLPELLAQLPGEDRRPSFLRSQ